MSKEQVIRVHSEMDGDQEMVWIDGPNVIVIKSKYDMCPVYRGETVDIVRTRDGHVHSITNRLGQTVILNPLT